jgi:hypothetical protein
MQHQQFMEQGFLRLGNVAPADQFHALQQRIDDIMLGRVEYDNMRFQFHDPSSGQLRRTRGNTERSIAYRRIDDLEQDPVFLAYIQHPLYRQLTRRYIGEDVSVFRSMFMNKPAGHNTVEHGTHIGWHQDVGKGWGIDTNPFVTVWIALDDATVANGCMQIVPGSHRHGIINEDHFPSAEDQARYIKEEDIRDLEAQVGEVILLHNLMLHRSGVNPSPQRRRAFSVTYMDAATRTLDTGMSFPVVFGKEALDPETVAAKEADQIEVFYG